ncbi:MAG: hypothetical protein IJR45_04085, partial [Firmicutes bacterium]|nr:hypothetical protein [Bacillota bacterium]
MKKTTRFETGRLVDAEGIVKNKVDVYKQAGSNAQPVGNSKLNPAQFPPRSAMITGEDGMEYDEIELLNGMAGNCIPNDGNTKTSVDFELKRKSVDLQDNTGAYVSVQNGYVSIGTDEEHFKTAVLNGVGIATIQDVHEAEEGMASESYVASTIRERLDETVQNITQADYDDLTQAEKTCGTMYFTTDTHKLYKNGDEYGGSGGVSDYTDLTNKPSINNVTLSGNKSLDDLGIGGHDNYTKTSLFKNTGSTNPSTITLSQQITDFDALIFIGGGLDREYTFSQMVLTSTMELNKNIGAFNDNGYVWYTLTSNTLLTYDTASSGTYILDVIGVCLGARKPYKETVLFENTSGSNPQTIQLPADIFDFQMVQTTLYRGSTLTEVQYQKTLSPSGFRVGGQDIYCQNYDGGQRVVYTITDGETLTYSSSCGGAVIGKIIGITYGGSKEVYEIGKPDYDARVAFTRADLPYTVPFDGYLYIGGYKCDVSLKYKDTDNNDVMFAFSANDGEISNYTMYPVNKGMILEYNDISGSPYMYIIPLKYQGGYAEVD